MKTSITIALIILVGILSFDAGIIEQRNKEYKWSDQENKEIKVIQEKCQKVSEEKFKEQQIISNIENVIPIAEEFSINGKNYIMSPTGPILKSKTTRDEINKWLIGEN